MHIVICGSMTASPEMLAAQAALQTAGHTVTVPQFTTEYAQLGSLDHRHGESVKNKLAHDLIRRYFQLIATCDGILVVNPARRGVTGYIGANTFLEMGFAHIFQKPIYLLYPPPNGDIGAWYADEIAAMRPIVLQGDLTHLN